MKGLIGVMAMVAVLALPASGAARGGFDSTLQVTLDFTVGNEKVLAWGVVGSEKHKCVSGRKVTGFIGEPGDLKKQDTAKTSAEGGFGLLMEDDGPVYKVKLAPKRVGGDLCKGSVYVAS